MSQINIVKDLALYSEYQPLVNYDQSIFAHEALMRNTKGIPPLTIIKNARNYGILYEIDTECITNAIVEYPRSFLNDYYLFINIFPSTIVHADFERFIYSLVENFPWIKKRIVFEISEDPLEKAIWGQPIFLKRLILMKSLEFDIAFDDVTLSTLTFNRIKLLTPNFVKLDHTFSKNLSNSEIKQQTISFLLEFINEEIKLVLEGIECEEDLETAKQLGISLLQGFYFAKPQRLSNNLVMS